MFQLCFICSRIYNGLYIKTDFKAIVIKTVWYAGKQTNRTKLIHMCMESWFAAYVTFQNQWGKMDYLLNGAGTIDNPCGKLYN